MGYGAAGRGRLRDRINGIVQPRTLHPFDNDPLVCLQLRLQDDAHPVVEQAPETNVPPLDDVALSDDEQVLFVLIGVHCGVGYQGRRILFAYRDPHAHAGTGDKPSVRVLGYAADQDRARALGVLVIRENQMALMRKAFFRVQAEVERDASLAERLLFLLVMARTEVLVPLDCAFVDIEIHVNRIDGHDRRQQRIAPAGVDEVAFGEVGLADLAGQVSGDLSVLQVELIPFRLGFLCRDSCVVRVGVCHCLFEFLL